MRTIVSTLLFTLLGLSFLACGSGGSTLAAAPTDGGDATTSDVVTTDVGLSSDGTDAVAEAGTDALVGQVDATAVEVGDAATRSSVDAAGDVVDEVAEAGPYMGSLPTPATSALFRFANWSSDSPTFDMCIAPHGTTSFQGPLLGASAAATGSDAGSDGLAFPLVSAYTLVPPGQYDARIVVGGADSCAVGILPDTTELPALTAGGAETVALAAEVALNATGFQLHVFGFLDDIAASGSAEIRVINAASAMPLIDVGTGSLSSKDFLAIFRGVQFGHAGTPQDGWIPFLVDTNGYNANKPISSSKLSAHASGLATDAVVSMPVSVPSGVVMTFVVAGGTSSTSPALVACADNAGTAGVLSDCNVLVAAGM
jgi:hypothetical protein